MKNKLKNKKMKNFWRVRNLTKNRSHTILTKPRRPAKEWAIHAIKVKSST